MARLLTRRDFVRGAAALGAGLAAMMAGCQPKVVEVEKVVTKEVVKEVTKEVVKEVTREVVIPPRDRPVAPTRDPSTAPKKGVPGSWWKARTVSIRKLTSPGWFTTSSMAGPPGAKNHVRG